MKRPTTHGKQAHPGALLYAKEYQEGKMDRREFMARATALGVTATAAYGLIGASAPAHAGRRSGPGETEGQNRPP